MSQTMKQAISKVPEVTLGFWVIKVIATTLGETGGDAVTMTLGLGYLVGTAIFAALFVVAVGAQIRARRFHPFLYWAVIVATTTAGTTLADFFDRSLGIGYVGGSSVLFALLLATLWLWHRTLGSVSVDSVTTHGRRCSTGRRSCSRKRWARRLATSWPTRAGWDMAAGPWCSGPGWLSWRGCISLRGYRAPCFSGRHSS